MTSPLWTLSGSVILSCHAESIDLSSPRGGPRVSVITAVHNGARYLPDAMRGLERQTYGDFEWIVVDDGSTDGSAELASAFSAAPVRVNRQSHSGCAVAWNRASRLAGGEYLAFLDADDAWLAEKLELQVAALDSHPEADLVFVRSRWIGEEGEDLRVQTRAWQGPMGFEELFRDNVLGNASSVMVRGQALSAAGGFDTKLRGCVDLECWLRIALLRPACLWGLAEPLTLYRRHGGQKSASWLRMKKGWELTVARLRHRAPARVARNWSRATSNMNRFWFSCALEGREYRSAAKFLLRSIRLAPGAFLTDERNWALAPGVLLRTIRALFSARARRVAPMPTPPATTA